MIADISPGEIREAAAFGCANFKDDPYYADVLAQGGEAELTRIFEKKHRYLHPFRHREKNRTQRKDRRFFTGFQLL